MPMIARGLVGCCLIGAIGCNGADIASQADQTGAIRVVTSISGAGANPGGYTIRIDDVTSHTLGPVDTLMVDSVSAGTHSVALSGLPQNCTTSQGVTATVNVRAGEVAQAEFTAVCEAPVTTLTVVVTTIGLEPDSDGYSLSFDTGPAQGVSANDVLVYENVSPGDHSISIEGLAPNCSVEGDNPASVQAIAGTTVRITTTIHCPVPGLILFGTIEESVGDHIWVVKSDGSGLRQLTNDHDDCARWMPDGRIVFVSEREGGGLFTMKADGTDVRQLFQGDVGRCPTWSPDMSKYVPEAEGSDHLYVVDADGSNRRLLSGAATQNFAWAPDGTRLAFVGTDRIIYSIDVNGSGLRPLTAPEGEVVEALSWSPDGHTIAFSVEQHPFARYPDLYFMNADGTNLRRVSTGFPYSWSPQGDRLLTVSRFPVWSGRILQADGTDLGDIGRVWDVDLSWAPNGRALVFTGPYQPGQITHEELWVMKPDGSGRTPITNLNVFGVTHPEWGP